MAGAERLAVLVTGKAVPVTALNDYGRQAIERGFRLEVFCLSGKRPDGLDGRIAVKPIKSRGRSRIGGKVRALLAKLARRGPVRRTTAAMSLLDTRLVEAVRSADALVALDPDAALAVWALARVNRRAPAVLGVPELARLAAGWDS